MQTILFNLLLIMMVISCSKPHEKEEIRDFKRIEFNPITNPPKALPKKQDNIKQVHKKYLEGDVATDIKISYKNDKIFKAELERGAYEYYAIHEIYNFENEKLTIAYLYERQQLIVESKSYVKESKYFFENDTFIQIAREDTLAHTYENKSLSYLRFDTLDLDADSLYNLINQKGQEIITDALTKDETNE
ncbi:hypothetical protein [Flammeovirga sp. SJP92]|uniref:hypothetical protein n=1 Tax=Flammeovirga sp. SJP92 TaxID=1775430 RepID=UPI0007943B50|nr:hypothetical protein [Flammeovirga sp. SJP92]KXX70828.1 hypothetical protein AVL50_11325 [Flammeovirga sp. SJP92]